jgi:hypothetical protein
LTVDGLGTKVWRSLAIGCAVLSVLVCAAAVAAGSARADAFTWLGPTSLVSTGGSRLLPTVSCPSTSQCTTVDGKGEQLTFNPSSGAILTRSAIDVGSIPVLALSCPSTAQCSAVDNGGSEITFDPATGAGNAAGRKSLDPTNHLTGVSCVSGTRCTAVDSDGQEVTFDPSSGAIVGSLNAIDGSTPLAGVSCLSSGQCTAVDTLGSEITFTVAAGAVTSSAAIDATRTPTSVSCPATTLCSAVDGSGYEVSFTPSSGAVLGSATHIDTTGGVTLNSVSCPTTSVCVTVDSLGNELTFSPTATPGPIVSSIDSSTFLAAVSCPAGASSCAAVDNHSAAVGFTTAGGSISRHVIVAPALAGVACPTRTQCTTIASGSGEVTFDPTTGTINGAGVQAVDLSANPLTAIACVSSTVCTAVDNGGNEVTFDPTTGNPIANGFISVDSNSLRSVACITPASQSAQCTAVDTVGDEVTFNPQTSTINNAGLSPVDGSGGALQSVSCPTGTQCTAVDSLGHEVTFNPVNGLFYGSQQFVTVDPGQGLDGVACPSAGQCTAVDQTGGIVTFLNPTSTAPAPPRQVIEVSNTPLTSISCPTAAQCTTVDGLGHEATFSPSSSSLNSSLLTPLPEANALPAVACQSTSICAAVDVEGNGFAGIEPPVNTTLPTITGTVQEHQQLTETNGIWNNVPTGYAHQWEDCTSATDPSTCAPISGATASTYTPTAGDIGQYVLVQEIAGNAGGSQPALSAATTIVTPAAPTNSVPPGINGASAAQQGQQLTDAHGTWAQDGSDPLTYAYQWADCDASGANCAPIAGAMSSTYTPTAADVGHMIIVLETALNSGGSSAPMASAPTVGVSPAAPPPIQAVSLPATPVQVTSSPIAAQLMTQGLAVSWQFVYGTTTNYTAGTPVESIPAGGPATVTVSRILTGLKPSTKYHYRIVETVSPGTYAPGATVYGQDLTFTTASLGKITLGHTRLSVSPTGAVAVTLVCQSPETCIGRFSITSRAEIGRGGARHIGNVLCDSDLTQVAAQSRRNVQITLAKSCLAVLQSAPGHRLTATLTARPRSGQHGLIQKVTLVATGAHRKKAPVRARPVDKREHDAQL